MPSSPSRDSPSTSPDVQLSVAEARISPKVQSTDHDKRTGHKGGVVAPTKTQKPLKSSIPSFVPTSQVVKLQSTMNRLKDLFTPTQSSTNLPGTETPKFGATGKFQTAKDATALFPRTKPEVDGEECLHDCESCTVALPRKWEIDESDELYGHVKGWDYHVVVATGKSDWVRDVIDEKGSLMEGLGLHGLEIESTKSTSTGDNKRRRVMLSASNMPTGGTSDGEVDARGKTSYEEDGKTNVIVLPAWKFVEGVSKNEVTWFMSQVVGSGPSNVDHLEAEEIEPAMQTTNIESNDTMSNGTEQSDHHTTISNNSNEPASAEDQARNTKRQHHDVITNDSSNASSTSIPPGIHVRTLHHKALILMCSHKTRDARCGQSAPLLRRELERHLRPLGLYRDLHDDRPNGVGIYFINHVGGHKYSANMMIYRRSTSFTGSHPDPTTPTESREAVQGIWLARVRPEDCENIVRYTVLQGKIVKPARQLRGGFDRSTGQVSW